MWWRRWFDRLRPAAIVAMAAAAGLAAGPGPGIAGAQEVTNPVINNFEIAPAGSLEWEMFDRLTYTHRSSPGDLPRLARLTVLESIAMYQNVRSDLPFTMMGARIEGEMTLLWDSAEIFFMSAMLGDAAGLARARPLLSDVEAAYDRLGATLGAMPGSAPCAALPPPGHRQPPAGHERPDRRDGIRPRRAGPEFDGHVGTPAQSRQIAEELGGLIQALRDTKPAPPDRDALIADLEALVELLKGFERTLEAGGSGRDVIESSRLLRSRVWPIEAAVPPAGEDARAGRPLAADPAADRRPVRPFRAVRV